MGAEVCHLSWCSHPGQGWPRHFCGRLLSALGGEMLQGSPIRGNAVVMYKV